MELRMWGVLVAAAAVAAPMTGLSAQGALLGQRARQLDFTPPRVQIWLQDDENVPFGAPVRVAFQVEDDAYIVVARVDAHGRLTVLFPTDANGRQDVRGLSVVNVRTIPDGYGAAFYANDAGPGLGFVFALASTAPFDLSSLERYEFQRALTARGVGLTPAGRRIADPTRVIADFADRIQFGGVPFSADLAFYAVDHLRPSFNRAGQYASCDYQYGRYGLINDYRRYGVGIYRSSLYGYSAFDDCADPWYRFAGYCSGFGYGLYGLAPFLPYCFNGQGQGVATGPVAPPIGPGGGPLNPWVTDSIRPPNPTPVDTGLANGPHIMTPVDENVAFIEGRNLRGALPRRGRVDNNIPDPFVLPPDTRVGSGPRPTSRGSIENRRGPDVIERPARGNPRADESERLPRRSGRQDNGGSVRDEVPRPAPRAQPSEERLPTRSSTPRGRATESTPSGGRNRESPPSNGSSGSGGRSEPRSDPPLRHDPPPRASAPPVRVDPPSPPPRHDPPPAPVTPPVEKKPGGGGSSQI